MCGTADITSKLTRQYSNSKGVEKSELTMFCISDVGNDGPWCQTTLLPGSIFSAHGAQC